MSKIKLAYPKIPGSEQAPLKKCYAFEKYDGTNLHWIWERELGWYAFGTRRRRFDLDDKGIADFNDAHPGLEQAPEVFLKELAEKLGGFFKDHPDYQSPEITVFTEFFGKNSFAGLHKTEDKKQLVMFDVEIHTGMIDPETFVRDFADFNIARVVYQGKLTGMFAEDVRRGKYNVEEGVVCKGGKGKDLWMIKIKTQAYMDKLKQAFADKWEDYWE